MADLHEALKNLGPVDWSDIPLDNLAGYLISHFAAGELIVNSVPPPPNGTPFESAEPHHHEPNVAKTAKAVHTSTARAFPPHEHHTNLQKGWGKPMKFNQSSNPLDVAVHKMASHDRHGAWFARASVHEGIGFAKFKAAMQREFATSLAVVGGPGEGAIRGIAADKRLEEKDVEGVGRLEAYQLSAQFPGPTTPRDFTIMVLSSEDALTEKSAAQVKGEKHVPRHFMMISKPVMHPDAPERSGYVRGQYESVEMIREIPLHKVKSKRKVDSATTNGEDPSNCESHDIELNPVEWIMITRSDPGGGLPRFLVERGTPDAMLGDVTKFLDWATGNDHPTREHYKRSQTISAVDAPPGSTLAVPDQQDEKTRPRSITEPPPLQAGGMFSTLTNAMGAGIDAYAPTVVSSYFHSGESPDSSDSSSDTSSIDSFISAEEIRRLSTAPEHPTPTGSTDSLSLASSETFTWDKSNLSEHDREIQKLNQQRERLDRKLAKKRLDEESRLKKSQEKEQSEQDKVRERHEREKQKTQQRHQRDLAKLERKKLKEARKAEEKRKKKDEATKLNMVTRERDDFRSQVDLVKRENALLMRQVEELQRENTAIVFKLGKLGGEDALRGVKEEIAGARKRAGSTQSRESKSASRSSKSREKSKTP
ncbi:Hypothetical protein R9X50_00419500 [Acrodontium crateriforme]|uniref:DUF3074 domain-containing protein n=1 Tax=Acrodontium crateriforme TaxID=150365 RepID=A0AAQ3M4Z4_9PEZI|nr:Hypothetical protein R9X50_00419500 [Acrodontium crateriforme]